MANDIEDQIEEHTRRFLKPDGFCLHCQRPANQHFPVGPITITVAAADTDEIRTHEFCEWRCFAQWVADQAGGVFIVGQN